MSPLGAAKGAHVVVTVQVPNHLPARVLCKRQSDDNGANIYYVLAECEGKPLKWRSMVKDNAVRRLKDEFIANITEEYVVDQLDVETIFFCSAEATTI